MNVSVLPTHIVDVTPRFRQPKKVSEASFGHTIKVKLEGRCFGNVTGMRSLLLTSYSCVNV